MMGKTCKFFLSILLLYSVNHTHYFMASAAMSNITSNTTASDQSALLAFKSHIALDPLNLLANNWSSSSSSICNWVGVSCDASIGRVTTLNLANMGLVGSIPPHLGNLSFLVHLDLHNNSFGGDLSRQLASLRKLKLLNLCTNNFTGEFPEWIVELSQLQNLSLCNNSFTGFVPELGRLLPNLTVLDLAYNRLSGIIPSTIFNISSLQVIDISYNFFSGNIPQRMGDLPQLRSINLSKSNLSGSIPSFIFNLSTLGEIRFIYNNLSGSLPSNMCNGLPILEKLDLSGNAFSGEIPASLHLCKELRYLNMNSNRLGGNLPSDIGKLSMLEQLDLSNNNLSGPVPPSLFNISSLRLINLRNNKFGGQLPEEMCNQAHSLQQISILNNKVGGKIPSSIANCTSLRRLYLGQNFFTGTIPHKIGDNLHNLDTLHLQTNRLTGSIPPNIFNLSGLKSLSLSNNKFSSNLPIYSYHSLSNLQYLYLIESNVSGEIPTSLFNATNLLVLSLARNSFTRIIPDSIGNLRNIQKLFLMGNKLTSDPASLEMSFLASLTKCRNLERLVLSENPLNGTLPNSIGNLSSSLERFNAWNCNIKGEIPPEIANLKKLFDLSLKGNEIVGKIPTTLGSLVCLQRLDLQDNKLSGSIPSTLCQLKSLNEFSLSNNMISGQVPKCVGSLSTLRKLYLDANHLNSTIPSSLWSLSNILEVNLSSNDLSGSLPSDIGILKAVIQLDLSMNQISGTIPSEIRGLENILNFSLANNLLQGPIPDSIGNILSLEYLDLSHNLLTSKIPKTLEKLNYLKFINLSYNRLQGEIPTGGPFSDFTALSFLMNNALCGRPNLEVPPCQIARKHRDLRKELLLRLMIPLIVASILVGFAILVILRRKSTKDSNINNMDLPSLNLPTQISYFELLEATRRFDESNLLGEGGFGSVFKGVLSNGMEIAVKVFNLDLQEASRIFDVECEAMRNICDRNLVKIISSCSNGIDFKALVMEFVPNGSLEKWLYSHNYFLSFSQRLNIMIDVASALEYLHHGISKSIVHCDLKPSNVLLDEDMVAHVCDFGISKLLEEGQSRTHTDTLATFGYIALEFGSKGMVSIKGDTYSYGVMLMEVFMRKKPTDEMFVDGLSLKAWVQESISSRIIQVLDPDLMEDGEHIISAIEVALLGTMELALSCCVESPDERMSMKDVLGGLNKIKTKFLQMSRA